MLRIGHLVNKIMRAAHDPAYGSAREQLAHELFDWHGGPMTGLYAVANAWLEGSEATAGDMTRALDELQHLLDDEVPQNGEMEHVRELRRRLEAETGSENP